MPSYGLTPQGVNIKRMDVILDTLHGKLSEKWGVNTRANAMSFLHAHLTGLADEYAALWEFGQEIYYAMYPSTATDIHLDYAAQFGGSTREMPARSFYPIHCTGIDGTVIPAGTVLQSDTNPAVNLVLPGDKPISRTAFNRAAIKVVSLQPNTVYTVALYGTIHSYTSSQAPTEREVIGGLLTAINNQDFVAEADEEKQLLRVQAAESHINFPLILSENLTTETVTSVINFATEECGDISLPDGSITNITKGVPGFQSCINLCGYISGRQLETDAEFRGSYTDKIFNRSSRMLESIKSAILMNVQGVKSIVPYENPSHQFDAYGRYPNSVEIVIEGGDPTEIALQILDAKAGGINTFGDVVVTVPGEYGEDILIRFNRPMPVYTWYRAILTVSATEALPPNYAALVKEIIVDEMEHLAPGQNAAPQRFIADIYKRVSGVDYVDIYLFTTTDASQTPGSYDQRSAVITPRQKAHTDDTMIEVVLDG